MGGEDFDSRDNEHAKECSKEAGGEKTAVENIEGQKRGFEEILAVDEEEQSDDEKNNSCCHQGHIDGAVGEVFNGED